MNNSAGAYKENDPIYWNDRWIAIQGDRKQISSPSRWDKKSQIYSKTDVPSTYVEEFLSLTKTTPGEHVLDMGCGPGNIAIPLAEAGCKVIAADFSAGMLGALKELAPETMRGSISPMQISWEEDWRETSLSENCVQTAISSRSISKTNLLESIVKLSWAASERCIVTVSADFSPKVDQRIFEICNIAQHRESDHYFLLKILEALGASPTCQFIPNQRTSDYDSFEDALTDYQAMLNRCLEIDCDVNASSPTQNDEHARTSSVITGWLENSLVRKGNGSKSGSAKLTLAKPRITTWAYITWDPNSIPQDLYQ